MVYGQTAFNRFVYASPPYGGSGYEKHQSGLRPFVVFFSATVLRLLELLRNSFIATTKPSYTTGTLYAICPKILRNV
jgi:hypothetical protein